MRHARKGDPVVVTSGPCKGLMGIMQSGPDGFGMDAREDIVKIAVTDDQWIYTRRKFVESVPIQIRDTNDQLPDGNYFVQRSVGSDLWYLWPLARIKGEKEAHQVIGPVVGL